MKKTVVFGLIALMTLCIATLQAQDKKKKKNKTEEKEKDKDKDDDQEKAPVFNYTIDDPMDAFGPKGNEPEPTTRYFLLPEFYTYWPVENNDTVYKYECYDYHHNPVIADTINDINAVYYISLIKTYNDYLHTTLDEDGKPRPKPIASIVYRYERTSASSWKSTDIANRFTMDLSEDKSTIVRQDTTVIVNPVGGGKQTTIRKYYKIIEGEKYENASMPENSTTPYNPSQKEAMTVASFLVPEFYFRGTQQVSDTTLEFLCYDNRDSLIPFVTDYDSVHYYSLYKKFIDSAHTYMDNGVKKPLPVSTIIKRYDHMANNKWMSIEYPSNKFTDLRGFKDVIVRSDSTVVVDPIAGNEVLQVFNYYKVIKN